MLREEIKETLGPALTEALEKRGFSELTPVQEAVLLEDAVTHDLRVSSQTGSGKTVAIGLALRPFLGEPTPGSQGVARPRALVVVPTRELAKQVQEELAWLFAPLGVRVMSVTGGGGYRDEMRAFAGGPAIIVGTPGRLLDHLTRGGVDPSQVRAAVLDEADRMLDLGFREDLESILGSLPEGHRTHLVSATFPREVRALADAVQSDVVNVEGTPIGRANADIEHVIHLVHVHERFDAIVNLLLENPGSQTLIFARTRADVAALTRRLAEAGFSMDSLSGEMEQRERTRALAAFKRGDLDALVATDVAARGIDVSDIATVIHADPPEDPDSYTHRSGRTGRAGKKGKSALIVTPNNLSRTTMLLRRAGVTFTRANVPDADKIRAREDEKLAGELIKGPEAAGSPLEPDDRALALARKLLASSEAQMAVGRLVMRVRGKRPEPRDVSPLDMHRGDPRDDRGPPPARDLAPRRARNPDARWVSFRVTWGKVHGAEVRRVLAMVCRRGEIQSNDVGSIHVAPMYSIVDVSESAAPDFAAKTSVPDPRDPRVTIHREGPGGGGGDRGRGGDRGGDRRDERPRPPYGKPRAEFGAPREDERPRREEPEAAPEAPPKERASRAKLSEEHAPEAPPKERASRAKVSEEHAPEAPPKERASRAKVSEEHAPEAPPKERASRAKLSEEHAPPKERVSRPKLSDEARASVVRRDPADKPRGAYVPRPRPGGDGPPHERPRGEYVPRPRTGDDSRPPFKPRDDGRPPYKGARDEGRPPYKKPSDEGRPPYRKPGGDHPTPYRKPSDDGRPPFRKPGGDSPAPKSGGYGKPKGGGYPRPKGEYVPRPKKPFVKK